MNEHSGGTRAGVPPSVTARACGICGVRDILYGIDWPWWVMGSPVHAACRHLPTTIGKARESARDAGSDINKEVVAPDQGSVRNATDERIELLQQFAADEERRAFGPNIKSSVIRNCYAFLKGETADV